MVRGELVWAGRKVTVGEGEGGAIGDFLSMDGETGEERLVVCKGGCPF